MKINFRKWISVYSKCLSKTFISNIKLDVSNHRNNFNKNRLGGVLLKHNISTLSCFNIKKLCEYCTSKFILEFSRQILKRDDFRLKALRYYEPIGHKMQWHTDTKPLKALRKYQD